MSLLQTQKKLSSIEWEKYWPSLSPPYLYYSELERDPYYEFLPSSLLENHIQKAMDIGIQAAKPYVQMEHLSFLNHVLKEDIRIHLVEKHPEQDTIRAQYNKKKQTIVVYKNSLSEIHNFLEKELGAISPIDLIALHVYHEWFHHLEETSIGKTDQKFPMVVIKQRGPFLVKRPLLRLREIAAHAFTQTVLGLTWSPLLLDQFRYLQTKGYTNAQIRESFQNTKSTYYDIINEK